MTTVAANSSWRRMVSCPLLVFRLVGCNGRTGETRPDTLSIPLATESTTPKSRMTLTPTGSSRASHQDGLLSIISPLENSEVSVGEVNIMYQNPPLDTLSSG